MGATESFQKALFLLDAGNYVRGEQILREVIGSKEANGDVLYYEACCCLGELLFELGRNVEGIPLLEEVAALEEGDLFDDVLDYQIQRARRLLNR
jgi:hypothetical protein